MALNLKNLNVDIRFHYLELFRRAEVNHFEKLFSIALTPNLHVQLEPINVENDLLQFTYVNLGIL